jgi:hypothetical protein
MRKEYRLLQGGETVAGSTSLSDILHYAFVYGQDGPVTIQQRLKGRWINIEDTPA